MTEKYNFKDTENATKDFWHNDEDWLIHIFPKPYMSQYEYAPVKDFYKIIIEYYDNGVIKERGKLLGKAKFGIWEYFDENGKLEKIVDEDRKLGKIKPNNVVVIIEQIGIINREEATSILLNRNDKPNKKDGSLYSYIENKLHIDFIPAFEEEKRHPVWIVNYLFPTEMVTYEIDGNTGKWKRHSNGAHIIR